MKAREVKRKLLGFTVRVKCIRSVKSMVYASNRWISVWYGWDCGSSGSNGGSKE